MIILGITGGVGSGKSKVLYDLKENHGAYVIEADKLAHELMEPGQVVYNKIVECFGKGVLFEEPPYRINRALLGSIVFSDTNMLNILNSISHPAVKENIISQIQKKKNEGKVKLFVIEAALLIEDGYKDICDEIWYIWVSREERIKRLQASRGYTLEKCQSIFESQKPDEYYKNNANFTINNENDYENSSKQLKGRLNKLLQNDIIDNNV